jgi:hypothetical protein
MGKRNAWYRLNRRDDEDLIGCKVSPKICKKYPHPANIRRWWSERQATLGSLWVAGVSRDRGY